MTEIQIGNGSVISEKAEFYGKIFIGENVFVDDGVRIGYPRFSSKEVIGFKNSSHSQFLDEISLNSGSVTTIGSNSIIRSNSQIYAGCSIGSNFDCGHNVIIREECTIGNFVYVRVGAEIKPEVLVGNNSVIGGLVGDRVKIGDNVTTLGNLIHTYAAGKRFLTEGAPIIKYGAFVGKGAIVLGKVMIGEFAQIAAGAIVVDDVSASTQVRARKSAIFDGESTLGK